MWIRGAAIVTGRVVAGMLLGLASRACPMLNGASYIGFGALADDGADAIRTVGLRREDGPIRAGKGSGGEQHQQGNSQARKRPDRCVMRSIASLSSQESVLCKVRWRPGVVKGRSGSNRAAGDY